MINFYIQDKQLIIVSEYIFFVYIFWFVVYNVILELFFFVLSKLR